MMKLRFIILVLWTLSVISCNSNKSALGIQINFEEQDHIERLGSRYIHLHVPSEVTIGSVGQVLNDDSYIYVFSSSSGESAVYVFDRSTGHFVKNIGYFGRGPEEYIFPSSITLDDDVLSIVDEGQGCIINYDTNSFNLLSKIESSDIGGFVAVGNAIFANLNSLDGEYAEHAFALLDKQFEVVEEFVRKPIVSGYIIGPAKPMYLYDSQIRAYTQLMPHVYELGESGASIVYTLRFGELKFPEQTYLKSIAAGNKDYTVPLFDSGFISYFNVYETKSSLLSVCIANHKRYLGIYDKNIDKGYLINEKNIESISPAQPFMVVGVMDDMFVSPIFVSDITDDNNSKELQTILNESCENDIVLHLISIN